MKIGKQTAIKVKYLQQMANIFAIPQDCDNDKIIAIKKGFQYFLISSFWNSLLGPSRTMLLTKSDGFTKVLGIDIMNEQVENENDEENKDETGNDDPNNNIPKDNIFALLSNENSQNIISEIETAMIDKNDINWRYGMEFIAIMIGSIFNHGYVKKGVDNNHLTKLLSVNTKISKQIADAQIDDNNQDQIRRANCLLTSLARNTMQYPLKFKDQTLEDIQIIRMMFHLIGVILSLPKSPFSILFHNPILYENGYLIGMPPDQMALLFRMMPGCGVWLCPNNHIYFLQDCTYPWVALKCEVCGADTGGAGHIRVAGNKGGRIDVMVI